MLRRRQTSPLAPPLGHTAPNPRPGAPRAARRWRWRSSPSSAPPAPLAAAPAPARPTTGQQGASRPLRWLTANLHRSRRPGRRHANPRLARPGRHIARCGVLPIAGPCTTLAASDVAVRPTPGQPLTPAATALLSCTGSRFAPPSSPRRMHQPLVCGPPPADAGGCGGAHRRHS